MGETVTRKKGYVPDRNKDYKLSRVSFDEAENGIVVSCSYTLSNDAREKMRKSEKDGMYCGSSYLDDEKHVFEDYDKAKAFVVSELDQLWADKGDGDGDESSD